MNLMRKNKSPCICRYKDFLAMKAFPYSNILSWQGSHCNKKMEDCNGTKYNRKLFEARS